MGKMDIIIANSNNVQKRIQKYLGCRSTVINPPCDTDKFTWKHPEGFFLSIARLDPLKRVDMVVRAFQKLPDQKLVVISGGKEFKNIMQLADGYDNIKVLGWVEEATLQELLSTCLATIYIPKDEDFGMSSVESMASGKPVIGIAEGGLLETIIDGTTGILLPEYELSVDLLCQTVSTFSEETAISMKDVCEERAAFFAKDIFLQKMKKIVMKAGDN